MRILHISRRYAPETPGGYEYNCQRFAEEWVERGHTVAVLTRRASPRLQTSVNLRGVRVFRALRDIPPHRNLSRVGSRIYHSRIGLVNRRNRSATRNILRGWQPDLVVFWGMTSPLVSPILATRAFGIPYVFDLGDYWLAEALRLYACPESHKRLYRSRFLLGGRFDTHMVEAAIVHSQYMRRYYVDVGVNTDALVVIHRGVDDTFLEVGLKRPSTVGKGPLRILCVGRLVPDKGGLVLVEAFVSLRARNTGVELHFYGDPESDYEDRLKRECERHGLLNRKVFIHGTVPPDRMPEIYANADILAFPVLWDEPSSNVLLEAMAAGLPIIATKTGSNSEFVRHTETGFLVDRGDVRGLYDALARLCADNAARTRMGQKGRARVLEAYRQQDVYDKTEIWLQNAIDARRHASHRR